MKASEEISEEQSRQLLFDVDLAYTEFFKSLSSPGPSSSLGSGMGLRSNGAGGGNE